VWWKILQNKKAYMREHALLERKNLTDKADMKYVIGAKKKRLRLPHTIFHEAKFYHTKQYYNANIHTTLEAVQPVS
jgi:hypothetical protein